MNQEFIEAYPDGIALSASQRAFMGAESTALYHQVAISLTVSHSESEIQKQLTNLVNAHFCLTASCKTADGYKGLRQFPTIVSSPIAVERVICQSATNMAELLLQHPIDICLTQGKVLQVLCITQHDNSQLLVLRVAALVADANSLLSLAEALSDALQNDFPEEEFLQFPQYLEWQQDTLESDEGIEGRAYWQQYVMTIDPASYHNHLPYRLPKEINEQASVLSTPAHIPSATWQSLKDCAQTADVTINDVLQAAWWLTITKIIGETGFVAGFSYDPRTEFEELAGALGVYQQTLPINVSYEPQETLINWLQKISNTANQHIQRAESIDDDYETNQLLVGFTQSFFIDNDNLTLHSYTVSLAHFELLMDVSHNDDEAYAKLHYLSSAYSAQAVSTLMQQYLHILSLIESKLDVSIDDLSLVSAQEKSQLLAMNEHKGSNIAPKQVLAKIYAYAATQGDSIALSYQEKSINYQDLTVKIDKMATWLMDQAVSHGDKVALCLPRSADLIISLLAVMRVGASYIPIDPIWPLERQKTIYLNAAPTLVLLAENLSSQDSYITNLTQEYVTESGESSIAFIDINSAISESNSLTSTAQFTDLKANDIAYVIYTSGSTGVPKGVIIEQQQLSQYCESISLVVNLTENKHFALTSTVAADLGNTSLFGALYNGATLHIASDEELSDGINFQQFLTHNAIDCLKIVPTHLQALLEEEPKYLPKKLILGGEACSTGLLNKLYQLLPHCQIYNHYGPSEATIGVMVHAYKNSKHTRDLVPKLSTVLPGSHVIILNKAQKLCAIGELGQLYIGGNQLARGYVGQSSDQGFCELEDFAGRWYPTGDLARYLPDNSIHLSGRCDQQIKVRGFRIEPAEVEQGIINALTVDSALVQLIHQGNQTQLLAYVVTNDLPHGLLNSSDYSIALSKLRTTLTDAMVPQHIIALASWPLLANGKLDKQSLPQLSSLINDEFIAPSTPLQNLLADTMVELLSIDKVSVNSSFFDLGADSLMVIRFVTRLRKLLLIDIEPGFIFDNASIAQLEKALEKQSSDVNKLRKLAQTQLTLAKLSPEQQAALRSKFSALNQ
ncbi:AMP-binding protein [Alteromonas sp. 5E99-2]|uniref:amino acid adenylation domain-containing protein n=1 Tax=Alteromonas sp. 5E99-2 TaxID=2817683 RepID=UPI001A99654D|nr:amino acid adenylation domain-containing protein [Alteromonas sp. 5E99-2]MBO1257068.1 AMP-binding protein [Alteromonas sp. 5E99-2]